MEIIKLRQKAVNKIIEALYAGRVIIFPTDTIYGFLADAGNKKAVGRIYKIKQRPKSKPLAVFIKDFKMAGGLAEINEQQNKILKKYWPGKYTFILKRKKGLKIYDGGRGDIALRIPKYKFLNDLIEKMNKPLVQTSVNISDSPSLYKISDIIEQFNKYDVLLVDGGNLKKSKPSKITDVTEDKIKTLRK